MRAGEVQFHEIGHFIECLDENYEVFGGGSGERYVQKRTEGMSFPQLPQFMEGDLKTGISQTHRVSERSPLHFTDDRFTVSGIRLMLETLGGDDIDGVHRSIEVTDQLRFGGTYSADCGKKRFTLPHQPLKHITHSEHSSMSARKEPSHRSSQSSGAGSFFHGCVKELELLIRTNGKG